MIFMKNFKNDFMLDPKICFLNHGSFGATPKPVFAQYQEWQKKMEENPVKFLGRQATELIKQSKQELAQYLGTSTKNIAYVENATTGINLIINALRFKGGDEVLSTNHEYGAMDLAWQYHSSRSSFVYKPLEIPIPIKSTGDIIRVFRKGITERTKIFYFSHITSPTAVVFPVKQICKLARDAGILTIVDGAHAPGQITLELDELGADFYVGNLHKWLCAPKGAGFLYAHPSVHGLIDPLIVSWGWQENLPLSQRISSLDWTGTRDISAFLTVPTAIQYQQENNWRVVQETCHQLCSQCRMRLIESFNLEVLYPDDSRWYRQMSTVVLPDQHFPDNLQSILFLKYNIEIPVVHWQGLTLLRFSFQAYNDQNDQQRLITALENEYVN